MNNIFENAYFGKEYRTKDNRKAIYLLEDKDNAHTEHILVMENCYAFFRYKLNGFYLGLNPSLDIISEWEDVIDEDLMEAKACAYTRHLKLFSNKLRSYAKQYFKVGYKTGWRDKK